MTSAQEPPLSGEDNRPSVLDDSVMDELMRREPLFHRAQPGTSREAFEAQTADDFWEVGASGQGYTREKVWAVLERRHAEDGADPWETSEFKCRQLSPDTYLLTYLLRQDQRITRRATIWQLGRRGWQIIYHQGTIVADPY